MEGVEKMNVVVVRGQEQGMETPRRDSYAMEVNRERNCYACDGRREGERYFGLADTKVC